MRTLKILILGGYGVFGGRLVQLLSDCPTLTLIVAGRNASKAEIFCKNHIGETICVPLSLDRINIVQALQDTPVDVVIDASGPFQMYGNDPYCVIRAALESGTNYLDFADGSDFVAGVSQFDQHAKDAGIFILSGVSSFPVLTAAVVETLSKDMSVHNITGGIAPSPYAGIGLNVMRAVVGYAGKPVSLIRNGKPATIAGLTSSRYYTIAPPGQLPLRNLRFSLVDVPDLQVIPPFYPDLKNIWMGAGPIPESLHLALNFLAKLRARKLLPSLVPFSKLFYKILNLAKLGEHRGGMFVEVSGEKSGQKITRSWHLLAEGDDGPLIPSMGIEVVVRNLLAGKSPTTGARAAIGELTLADYETLFEKRTIITGIRENLAASDSIFQQVLDTEFDHLATTIQRLHCPQDTENWAGRAQIDRGTNPVSTLIATLFRFPKATPDTTVTVAITCHANNDETWRRTFAGKTFKSHLRLGQNRNHRLIMESFGPFSFGLAMVTRDAKLYYVPRGWRFLGVSMPRFLTPNGVAYEVEIDGKFHFDVEIAAPLIGRIVRYRGWLTQAE